MPTNQLNITLTAAQVTAITTAITSLQTNLPFGLNLSAEEKVKLQNIKDKRYPYAQRTITMHAPGNPRLQPAYMTLSDATTDFTLYNQLNSIVLALQGILEMYTDTQAVAGHESYEYLKEFYNSAKRAKEQNVPGADAVYQDLKTLFEEQGGNGGVVTP